MSLLMLSGVTGSALQGEGASLVKDVLLYIYLRKSCGGVIFGSIGLVLDATEVPVTRCFS